MNGGHFTPKSIVEGSFLCVCVGFFFNIRAPEWHFFFVIMPTRRAQWRALDQILCIGQTLKWAFYHVLLHFALWKATVEGTLLRCV